MWTCASTSPLFLPNPHILRRQNSPNFITPRNPNHPLKLRSSASLIAESTHGSDGGDSWITSVDGDCNGWAVVKGSEIEKKRGFSRFVLVGVGASVALAIAAVGYFSVTRKGLMFEFRKPVVRHEHVVSTESEEMGSGVVEDNELSVEDDRKLEERVHEHTDNVKSESEEKVLRILKPVDVDSTQEEALSVLAKLQIIESETVAGELCTRREYARWLVKLNTLLERNPRHRIICSISFSGSTTLAFDDIATKDPDFGAIQGLAEAGILPSKLSADTFNSSHIQGFYFYPERPITRQDLVSWKAHFEYESVAGIEEASRPLVDYIDIKTTSLDVSPALSLDMLAGDKSITRKVFGKTMRFEPKKPVTKAQAAVALTSGRMSEAIKVELQRLEAEKYARQLQMAEIRSELLERGEINEFWKQILDEEATRKHSLEKYLHEVIKDLEQEKIAQVKFLVEHAKEHSALDCQRKLIISLKEEISELTKKLESEKATCAAEQESVQAMLTELRSKLEVALDAKSVLETEKQAVTMLRTWVEDEARKNQARAKLLEEVGRRWNWNNQD